jgi:predicted aspartyl protease
MDSLTLEQCKQWSKNKLINPITNRKIKENGPTYIKIEKKCKELTKKERKKESKKDKDKELQILIQKIKDSKKPKIPPKQQQQKPPPLPPRREIPDDKIKVKIVKKKRPFINVIFEDDNGIEVSERTLIDTGAVRSSISKRVANLLLLDVIGEASVTVGSGDIDVREIVEIIINVENENGDIIRKTLDVTIRKQKHSLLGMDWIGTIKPDFIYKN